MLKQLLFYFRPRCGYTLRSKLHLCARFGLYKGAAILETNKRMMKTDNIRKLVRTNYVTNIYIKTGIVLGQSRINIFFLCLQKKKKKITVSTFFDSRSGNQKT